MSRRVDLFRIVAGDSVWTFNNSKEDVVYSTETYSSLTVTRGTIEQKNEISKANIEVNIPIDHEISTLLLTGHNEQIMSLTIFTQRDVTTSVSWKGRLSSYTPSREFMTLNFESVFTSMRRPGLRAVFQKNCRFALYGRGCNLDPADFQIAGTVESLTGNVIEVTEADAQADGYFTGGMLSIGTPPAYSFIVNHVGKALTLQRVSAGLAQLYADEGPAIDVLLYPGCDLTRATCDGTFDNLLNYGGFDFIPDKNPMGGSNIF